MKQYTSGFEKYGSALTISSDPHVVRNYFKLWREALLQDAIRDKGLWRHPEYKFVFSNQDDRQGSILGPRTSLGVDILGEVWAVQINEAEIAGDLNVTSAVGFDQQGKPFLLRQGRLNPNSQSKRHILYGEFKNLTGLKPVKVENGNTKIERDWYIVTPLNVASDEIRRNTAGFIDACVLARTQGVGVGSLNDLELIREFSGNDETGGTYVTGFQLARDPSEVRKLQGDVWQNLAAILRNHNIVIEKPRHAGGYEVDAEIVNGDIKLLVEIKTDSIPSDIYTGVGQLNIYSKLLPRVATHKRILLLPSLPKKPLINAISECNIKLCTYKVLGSGDDISITFSDEFLTLCGL